MERPVQILLLTLSILWTVFSFVQGYQIATYGPRVNDPIANYVQEKKDLREGRNVIFQGITVSSCLLGFSVLIMNSKKQK